MSLPMSKLVCGMGDAPVTGAWMPITISVSLTPAVSLPPGWNGPGAGGGAVVVASAVVALGTVVAPGVVVAPATVVAAAMVVSTGAAVNGGRVDPGAAVVAAPPPSSPVPATPDFWPHAAATRTSASANGMARRARVVRRRDGVRLMARPSGRGGGRGTRSHRDDWPLDAVGHRPVRGSGP